VFHSSKIRWLRIDLDIIAGSTAAGVSRHTSRSCYKTYFLCLWRWFNNKLDILPVESFFQDGVIFLSKPYAQLNIWNVSLITSSFTQNRRQARKVVTDKHSSLFFSRRKWRRRKNVNDIETRNVAWPAVQPSCVWATLQKIFRPIFGNFFFSI